MLNKTMYVMLVLGLLFTGCASRPDAAEPHAEKVLGGILAARDALKSLSSSPPLFVTFWDFDGTIILGDCTLGHRENGARAYSGLAEEAIARGYSGVYGKKDYRAFQKRYLRMEAAGKHREAAVFIARIFKGAKTDDLLALSRGHFDKMRPFYFSTSMHIIRSLQREGIGVYILSASPEYFVKGGAATAGVPEGQIFGIRPEVKDGRATGAVLEPVTYGPGKVMMLLEILERLRKENPGREVYVLAGFGNSYHTDGDFLKWIAQQNFPASKPVAVMINGGKAPARYAKLFTAVGQSKTTAGVPAAR